MQQKGLFFFLHWWFLRMLEDSMYLIHEMFVVRLENPWLKRGQESSWCAISLHLGCWNMWGKATTKITISLGLGDSYQPSLSHWYWQGHIPCIYCNRIYMILNGRIGTVCCSQGTRKHLRPTARKKVSAKTAKTYRCFFQNDLGFGHTLCSKSCNPWQGTVFAKTHILHLHQISLQCCHLPSFKRVGIFSEVTHVLRGDSPVRNHHNLWECNLVWSLPGCWLLKNDADGLPPCNIVLLVVHSKIFEFFTPFWGKKQFWRAYICSNAWGKTTT